MKINPYYIEHKKEQNIRTLVALVIIFSGLIIRLNIKKNGDSLQVHE